MTATITTDVRDMPDTAGYLAIHRAMRTANEQLVTGLVQAPYYDPKRAAAIGRWFEGYATELHTHHHLEDDLMFPALAERAAAYVARSDSLTADHRRLDELIDGIRGSVARWAKGDIDEISRRGYARLARTAFGGVS
jgi:hemerythrin-like domain-containing protein